MLSEFRLPALGADMDEGTVVQWNVAPGDTVKRGQVVAVVETDKGAIDVEIFEDGIVRELLVPPGTKVPVGTVLARVETSTATAASTAREPGATPDSAVPLEVRSEAGPARAAGAPSPEARREMAGARDVRARISPAARVRARELGVDVAPLHGSGPSGAITLEDVEKAASMRGPAAAGTEPAVVAPAGDAARVPASGMREAIASAMSRSKREIPHYYLSVATDITAATEWLTVHNAAVPVTERLLFAALLIKAVALACREFKGFSGFFRDGHYEESASVHVGVAVAIRGGGLVAPAIVDTAEKALPQLMEDFRGVVSRARAGRLRASELAAPSIILTSLGDSAVDAVFPIIQPPQVAIVGAGMVAARPWVVDGRLEVRQVVTLSLGADHRVTDGRLGAQFLARIASLLATPEKL